MQTSRMTLAFCTLGVTLGLTLAAACGTDDGGRSGSSLAEQPAPDAGSLA
jgi:hypothetical protein